MKEDVKQQHLQIIEKIKKKYDGKTNYRTCQHFVINRIDGLTEQVARDVMHKFLSMFGKKDAYSDEELVMMILVCIVAQKGLPFKDVEPKSFYKYKNKSLQIKPSKSKEEPGDEVKKPTQEGKEQKPKTAFEKKERGQEEEAAREVPKPSVEAPPSPPLQLPQMPPSPEFQKTLAQEEGPSFSLQQVIQVSGDSNDATDPPRKFSFGNDNELQSSISTKMAPIEIDEINETLPQSVDTPTFVKRAILEPSSRFMESQLQLSTHLASQPKELKLLTISIERYVKQTEFFSTVVRYEIRTPNSQHPPVLRRYSEFLKLQNYLRDTYKGMIIPELPPKESIVSSLIASSESTLIERKKGLQEFINKCLAHEVLGRDPVLLRFIDDQNLEESCYNQQSLRTTAEKYITSLWNITASTEQIKDYGIAYFSYLKQVRQQPEGVPDRLQQIYNDVLKQMNKSAKLREYLDKLQVIHLKRVKAESEYEPTKKVAPISEAFKKQLDKLLIEYSEAKKTYSDFCTLKDNKSWLEHLYGAKVNKAGQQQLLNDLKQAERRVQRVQPILEKEMSEFFLSKEKQWPQVLRHFCSWKLSLRN